MHALPARFFCTFLLSDCFDRPIIFFMLFYLIFRIIIKLSHKTFGLSPSNVPLWKIEVKYPGCVAGLAVISTLSGSEPIKKFLQKSHQKKANNLVGFEWSTQGFTVHASFFPGTPSNFSFKCWFFPSASCKAPLWKPYSLLLTFCKERSLYIQGTDTRWNFWRHFNLQFPYQALVHKPHKLPNHNHAPQILGLFLGHALPDPIEMFSNFIPLILWQIPYIHHGLLC